MGLRNAAGIALPLVIGVELGQAGAGLVASTGALNVAVGDGLDSYRSRAARMLTSSVIVGLAIFLGALCGWNIVAAVTIGSLWAFASGLVVALGAAAADIGMISLVVVIIYSAQPMPLERAAWAGLIGFAGGLLQTVLSIALWPVRGLQPERRAIADLYTELGRAATTPPDPYGPPLASKQSTQARLTLSSLANDHRVEAERLLALVSQAERMRLSLFALTRSQARLRREGAGQEAADAIKGFLEAAANQLASIGQSVRQGPQAAETVMEFHAAETASLALQQLEEGPQQGDIRPLVSESRFQLDALAGQLRAALDLANNAGELAFAQREARVPQHLKLSGWFATLRANLTLESSACRHAIRLAICIALGEMIARSFSIARPYWLPMTVALVLKPDFGSTLSRGALRLAGTYAGLALATLLFHFASPTPLMDALWIFILAFLQRSYGRANYGILVTAISALIVFLFSLTGISPQEVIASRALNSTIGGALALAIYWAWPTRERTQARQAMASMLDAYRLYFRAIANAYLDPGRVGQQELDRLRFSARVARSNVETAVDRLAAEPYADPEQLRVVNAALAASHRFIHAVMAAEAGLATPSSITAGQSFQKFTHDLEKTLYFLAACLRGSPLTRDGLPDLRQDHSELIRTGKHEPGTWVYLETDRMTNSLNTLAELLFRWVQPPQESARDAHPEPSSTAP